MQEYRYSDRVVLRVGDTIRARGGPTYRGERVGDPGLYNIKGFETSAAHPDRVWITVYPVDKYGVQSGGVYLLYICGEAYSSDALPALVNRPYKVSKLRDSSIPIRSDRSSPRRKKASSSKAKPRKI